jgi:GNAT superfamily N-acetyltransferase
MTVPPYPVELRTAQDGDQGFVMTSWLESYHQGSRVARATRWADYREPMRRIVRRLLRRSVCLVACDPEEPSHLLGFAVGERDRRRLILHYLYVRQTRRRSGLATMLVGELARRLGTEGITYTHETHVVRDLVRGRDARWNPWIVWGEEVA